MLREEGEGGGLSVWGWRRREGALSPMCPGCVAASLSRHFPQNITAYRRVVMPAPPFVPDGPPFVQQYPSVRVPSSPKP